jgi:hypothetical protein
MSLFLFAISPSTAELTPLSDPDRQDFSLERALSAFSVVVAPFMVLAPVPLFACPESPQSTSSPPLAGCQPFAPHRLTDHDPLC